MPELKCIYCLRNLPEDAFNTEHVVLQALGKFENNLTLNQIVCCDCNQFFGDNLDRVFARDSFEAYDRIKRGLKPAVAIADYPQERLTFSVALSGEWNGIRLRLAAPDGREAVELVPQVGLRKKDGPSWVYVTEAELADPDRNLAPDIDEKGQIRIIADSAEGQERLTALLAQKGIPFRQEGTFALPGTDIGEITVYVNTKVDPIVKRCVAKMSFNYLARVAGRDFVLLPAFDAARAYVRYGQHPGYSIVDAGDTPILAEDTPTCRQTDGHLVTVGWKDGGQNLVGQLSLFNRVTYCVNLARNFSGLWRPIRSGHHFNLAKKTIAPLIGTSLEVPSSRPQ